MTPMIRQNIYAAWLDGDAMPMEALRSLCSDYEELDGAYRDFGQMREQLREQIGNVLLKLDGRADVPGFGKLTLAEPVIVRGFDKAKIQALINDLIEDHPDIAARLVACETKSARAGGLRIEREKATH
jgi:hypothetical protein